jgi:hypothetical protein
MKICFVINLLFSFNVSIFFNNSLSQQTRATYIWTVFGPLVPNSAKTHLYWFSNLGTEIFQNLKILWLSTLKKHMYYILPCLSTFACPSLFTYLRKAKGRRYFATFPHCRGNMWEMRNACKILNENPQGIRSLGTSRYRLWNSLREAWCEGADTGFNSLRLRFNVGLLWIWQWMGKSRKFVDQLR